MKRWIKRTLVGGAVATLLFGGGLAAYAHRQHGDWNSAEMQARMVDRVGSKLDLDAAQRGRLATVGETLRAQRQALMAGSDPRTELQSLISGPSFDRARAGALASAKLTALQTGSPAVIDALADFYDSLNPKQQAQVREFMASRGHHGEHRD
ncbi:MAG: Spy/CpxP family protein refolding chaperone [Pseudomonadota bacterium]|nr:Spy/CpxP family protein refolding chaperone [Pseudomonadota bacterium]